VAEEKSTPRETPSPRALAEVLPLGLLGVLLLYDLARFARGSFALLRSPVSRDYGEGCVLAMVQLLAERGSYFPAFEDYPFVHGNYPPVFPLLVLPAHLLFGPSLLVPRLLSLAATAGLALVLALLARRATRSLPLAGAFALLLLAPWFVQTWAALGRVDMLACLLSLAGLHLFHGSGPTGRGRWAAYACFVLAFFTKQNALLAPAAAVLGLLLDAAGRRHAGRVLLEIALPLALAFGLLAALTGGLAWRHLVPFTAAADFEWDRMRRAYRDFLALIGPFLAFILPAMAALGRSAREGPAAGYLAYWTLNLLALVTIAKAGAAQNYFIEPYVATLALSAALLGQAARQSALLARAGPAFLLVAAGVATFADMERGRARLPPQEPAELLELYQAVRTAPGPVLSEDLSALVLAGKPVLVEPFGVALISRHGLFDPRRIEADCRAGRFALVVSDYRLREIAGLGACFDERYGLWKRLSSYVLLRPRSGP
jgi:hypothetical protein